MLLDLSFFTTSTASVATAVVAITAIVVVVVVAIITLGIRLSIVSVTIRWNLWPVK